MERAKMKSLTDGAEVWQGPHVPSLPPKLTESRLGHGSSVRARSQCVRSAMCAVLSKFMRLCRQPVVQLAKIIW